MINPLHKTFITRICIFILIPFLCQSSHSQSKNMPSIDSENSLLNLPYIDSTNINGSPKKTNSKTIEHSQTAHFMLSNADSMLIVNDSNKAWLNAKLELSSLQDDQNNLQSASSTLTQIMNLDFWKDDPILIIKVYNRLSAHCRHSALYDSAMNLINSAIVYSRDNNNYMLNQLRVGRAVCYSNNGHFSEALSEYFANLQTTDSSDYKQQIWLLDRISQCYLYAMNLSLSKTFLLRSIKKAQEHDLKSVTAWYCLGRIFYMQNKLDSSLYYFEQTTKNYGRDWDNAFEYDNSIFHIWRISCAMNRPDHHKMFLDFRNENKKHLYSTRHPYLIPMLAEMLIYYKDYETAEHLLLDGLYKIAMKQKGLLEDYYEWLAKVKEKKGDYQEALQYYQAFKAHSDSMRNFQTQKEIAFLQEKFNSKEHEAKILKLNHINEQKSLETQLLKSKLNNGILASFIMAVLIISGILYLRYIQKLRLKRLQDQNIIKDNEIKIITEKNKSNIMKSYIKGQEKERNHLAKELHDDVGARLAAIRYFLQAKKEIFEKEDQKKISSELSALHTTIRNVSHKLIKPEFNQINLPDLIKEQLKWLPENQTAISFICKDKINWTKIPEKVQTQIYRIAQESLSNSLKHAQAQNILIQIRSRLNILELEVADDGIGLISKPFHENGIGMRNMKTRAESIGGNFEVISKPKEGTRIIAQIPLN
ncbi:MAG: hypothetical protein JEZ03_06845 [Bacteroidales bacterium]|nr:hypothetical protein [Bacteroidales bacterium]